MFSPRLSLERPETSPQREQGYFPPLLALRARATSEPIWVLSAPFIVWGVWTVWTLWGFLFVLHYTRNVPVGDDWEMVPYIVKKEPLTLDYLWALHAEHRIPLPKLVTISLAWLAGGDIRSSLLFNISALSGLAAAFIWAARRVRGSTSYADMFFPLALLHLGHYVSLLWCSMVHHVVVTILTGTVLIVIVLHPRTLSLGAAVLAGCCVLLLPTCGAVGVALVPVLGAWLLYSAVRAWFGDAPDARRAGLVTQLFLGATAVLLAAYAVNFHLSPYTATTPSVLDTLFYSWRMATASFGVAAMSIWPVSGYVVLGLLVLTLLAALDAMQIRADVRLGLLGLLAVVGAVGVLILVIGYGRGPYSEVLGLNTRFTTLTVLMLCGIFYVWEYCPRRGIARTAQAVLCLLVAGLLVGNTRVGNQGGRSLSRTLDLFEKDLQAGLPAEQFAVRYPGYFYPTMGVTGIAMLRDARVGSFRLWSGDRLPPESPPAIAPRGDADVPTPP
jgi:hypothetical protein